MFRTVPLSITRSFSLYTAMVYVIQVLLTACEQDLSCKLSANLYDIYHCCVYSGKTLGDGKRNCPKHVEFYSKNKFEKLVNIVGFIITAGIVGITVTIIPTVKSYIWESDI